MTQFKAVNKARAMSKNIFFEKQIESVNPHNALGLFGISQEFKKEVFDQLSYRAATTNLKVYAVADVMIHCFSGPKYPFTPVNENFPFEVNGTTYASVYEFLTEKLFVEVAGMLPRNDLKVNKLKQFDRFGGSEINRQKWILNRGLLYMQLAYLEKCKQHPEFLEKLKDTGRDSIIAYSYQHDTFFGIGGTKNEVEMWKHYQGSINACVVYPTPFPVLQEDLRKIPRIAYGYNVLGALLMSLREQLLTNPINSIAVHIPDRGFKPFVVRTHPTMDFPFSNNRPTYRRSALGIEFESSPADKRRRIESDQRELSPTSTNISLFDEDVETTHSPQPFGDMRPSSSNASVHSKGHQSGAFFFNNNSARRHSSQSGFQAGRVETPQSALERWNLASAPPTPMEQVTTYSCMNTPIPFESEEVEEDNVKVEEGKVEDEQQNVPPINNEVAYQPPMPNLLEVEKSISNCIDIFKSPPSDQTPAFQQKSLLKRLAKNSSPVTSESFPLTINNRIHSASGIFSSPGISRITAMMSSAFVNSPILNISADSSSDSSNSNVQPSQTDNREVQSPNDSGFKTPRLPSRLQQCASVSPSKSKEQPTLYTLRDIKRRQLGSLDSIPSSSMSLSTNYDYTASSTASELSDLDDDELVNFFSQPSPAHSFCSPARDADEVINRIKEECHKK